MYVQRLLFSSFVLLNLTACLQDATVESSGSSFFSYPTINGKILETFNITNAGSTVTVVGVCPLMSSGIELSEDNGATWFSPGAGSDVTCANDTFSIPLPAALTGGIWPSSSFVSYTSPEQHSFRIRAQTMFGPSNESQINVRVAAANNPPVLNLGTCPSAATEGLPYSCTLNATDADGDPVFFYVDISHSCTSWLTISGTGGTRTLSGTPDEPGLQASCQIAYYVSDGAANSPVNGVSLTISPVNDAPVLSMSTACPTSVTQGTAYACSNLSVVDVDVPADTISWSPAASNTCAWLGVSVTGVLSGTPASAGACHLAVVANDGSVDSNVIEFGVTVNAISLTLAIANPASVNEDWAGGTIRADADVQANLEGSGTYTLVTATAPDCSAYGSISLTNSTTGEIFFSPNTNVYGMCNVRVRFTHTSTSAFVEDEFQITINPIDDAPIANNISPSAFNEDVQSIVTLSYTDVEGDLASSCTISSAISVSVTQACACAAGVCTVGVKGALNYNGAASFEFTVTANGLVSNWATATLTINSVNDAPVVNAPSIPGVCAYPVHGNAYSCQLTASDVDGDVTFTWALGGTNTCAGLSINATGMVTGTPSVAGDCTLPVVATDLGGASSAALPVGFYIKPKIYFDISNSNADEADAATPHQVIVRLSATTTQPVGFNIQTEDYFPTAEAQAGSDYTAISANLTISAGQSTFSVNLNIENDTETEPDERFQLRISAPANAVLGANDVHVVTILDNDTPPMVMSVQPQSGPDYVSDGDEVYIEVTFDQAITVSGPNPRIELNTDPVRYAEYDSGSGTDILTFRYSIQPGDSTANGVSLQYLDYLDPASLNPNGATIVGAANTIVANLTLPPIGGSSLSGWRFITVNPRPKIEKATCPYMAYQNLSYLGCKMAAGIADPWDGVLTYSYHVAPTDPGCVGLSLNGATGEITGTPTGTGICFMQVKVYDGNHYSVPYSVVFNVHNGHHVSQVATGGNHSCAVIDKKVKCWGRNFLSGIKLLGDNFLSATTNLKPGVVKATSPDEMITNALRVAVAENSACVLHDNQQVSCWGDGSLGKLGNGSTTSYPQAYPIVFGAGGIPADRKVVQISGMGSHYCALTTTADVATTGEVYCWGANSQGQLGDGTITTRTNPTQVRFSVTEILKGAIYITAGLNHSCAILADRSIACWGDNQYGGLGLESSTLSFAYANYVKNFGPEGEYKKPIFVEAGDRFTCALNQDDMQLYCWGLNQYGELGRGDSLIIGRYGGEMQTLVPVNFGTGYSVREFSLGFRHACADVVDSTDIEYVKCWGYNNAGQLGLNDTIGRGLTAASMGNNLPPVHTGTGQRLFGVSIGISTSCAIVNTSGQDDQIKCWGYNDAGQVGVSSLGTLGAAIGDSPGELTSVTPAQVHPVIFTSAENSTGNSSLVNLANLCQVNARDAGWAGASSVRPLVSSSTLNANAMNTALGIGGSVSIYNSAAARISSNWTGLWGGSLLSVASRDASGAVLTAGADIVMTGSIGNGTYYDGFNCNDWDGSAGSSMLGRTGATGSTWFYNSTGACSNTTLRVYCVSP